MFLAVRLSRYRFSAARLQGVRPFCPLVILDVEFQSPVIMSADRIHRIGLSEFWEHGISTYRRRVGTEQWQLVRPVTPEPVLTTSKSLMLVRQDQAIGEPYHWSLFLAEEGRAGMVYQLKGDATFMSYRHAQNVNQLASESFRDGLFLAELSPEQIVQLSSCVDAEAPPQAANQALAVKNCQGWTIRVIAKLVVLGLVMPEKLEAAKKLQEPV